MSDRAWSEEQFGEIYEFLKEHETSPSQTKAIEAFYDIALSELGVIDENDIISTCAEALCVLATPYAESPGFDPAWKVDLS